MGLQTIIRHSCVTCGLCWQDRKNKPGFSIGTVFARLTSCKFCCLEAWHLAEENQKRIFPAKEKKRCSWGGNDSWDETSLVPQQTGQQNCPLEVPVYLLTTPLTTVRMRCICWLKLRENKHTLHLQSFCKVLRSISNQAQQLQ